MKRGLNDSADLIPDSVWADFPDEKATLNRSSQLESSATSLFCHSQRTNFADNVETEAKKKFMRLFLRHEFVPARTEDPAHFDLYVEGHVLDPYYKNISPFCSFFKSIQVVSVAGSGRGYVKKSGAVKGDGGFVEPYSCEWSMNASPGASKAQGCCFRIDTTATDATFPAVDKTIVRNVKVILERSSNVKQLYTLSPSLSNFFLKARETGKGEYLALRQTHFTFEEVLFSLWTYIDLHRLVEGKDHRVIRCDEALSQALSAPQAAAASVSTGTVSSNSTPAAAVTSTAVQGFTGSISFGLPQQNVPSGASNSQVQSSAVQSTSTAPSAYSSMPSHTSPSVIPVCQLTSKVMEHLCKATPQYAGSAVTSDDGVWVEMDYSLSYCPPTGSTEAASSITAKSAKNANGKHIDIPVYVKDHHGSRIIALGDTSGRHTQHAVETTCSQLTVKACCIARQLVKVQEELDRELDTFQRNQRQLLSEKSGTEKKRSDKSAALLFELEQHDVMFNSCNAARLLKNRPTVDVSVSPPASIDTQAAAAMPQLLQARPFGRPTCLHSKQGFIDLTDTATFQYLEQRERELDATKRQKLSWTKQ